MNKLSPYYKALAGFIGAAIVAYLGATDGGVTGQEWLQILLAGLGGSGLVFVAPKNRPSTPFHEGNAPAPKPGERGAVALTAELVCLLILTVVVVLWYFGVRP